MRGISRARKNFLLQVVVNRSESSRSFIASSSSRVVTNRRESFHRTLQIFAWHYRSFRDITIRKDNERWI